MEPTGFSLAPRTFLDRALELMESSGCEWYLWLCPGCYITSAQGHCSCAQGAIPVLLRVTVAVPKMPYHFSGSLQLFPGFHPSSMNCTGSVDGAGL